jgi:hypothetical protein
LIPIYSRTEASPAGKKEYTFCRRTGWSNVPPYIAGIYALACQVKPDITPEIFWEAALKTGEGRIVQKGEKKFRGKIINNEKNSQANYHFKVWLTQVLRVFNYYFLFSS